MRKGQSNQFCRCRSPHKIAISQQLGISASAMMTSQLPKKWQSLAWNCLIWMLQIVLLLGMPCYLMTVLFQLHICMLQLVVGNGRHVIKSSTSCCCMGSKYCATDGTVKVVQCVHARWVCALQGSSSNDVIIPVVDTEFLQRGTSIHVLLVLRTQPLIPTGGCERLATRDYPIITLYSMRKL